MRICGIDLKANNTIFCVMDKDESNNKYIDMKIRKITLENDESQEDIRSYCNDLLVFLKKNNIEKIVIKKRAKKGNFAGGAVTFKMEAWLQLNPHCEVELISSARISSYQKKNSVVFPPELNKYQEQAYLSALACV